MASALAVERVDFVSVPTQDVARSKKFYGETLALPHETDTSIGAEYRAGQVTLGIWSPEAIGFPFTPNKAGIALRVADVPRRGLSSSRRVSSSWARPTTPACVTWRSSPTPTETA